VRRRAPHSPPHLRSTTVRPIRHHHALLHESLCAVVRRRASTPYAAEPPCRDLPPRILTACHPTPAPPCTAHCPTPAPPYAAHRLHAGAPEELGTVFSLEQQDGAAQGSQPEGGGEPNRGGTEGAGEGAEGTQL
jgi:hypothetical protein